MRKSILFFILMAIAITSTAQTIGDAFYIFRNDGEFNAFFREEVDSIVYSFYDSDSIYHDDVVTQLVYTPDSVYKIPLAAIDSVGFVQPEIKLQPNVKQMSQEGLMDYLQAVEGMTLFFKPTIPNNLQPIIGDILLNIDFDNPLLSEGFVGKVHDKRMTGEAFIVDCDSIYDLLDVFEQLISIEMIKDNSNATYLKAPGEYISERNSLNFDLGYSHKVDSLSYLSLSGSVDGTYIATIIYNISRKEQYFKLKLDHDWQYGAHINFKKELGKGDFGFIGPVKTILALRFPTVAPVFKFEIAGAPFAKGVGEMELDLSLNSPKHSYVAQAVYNNGHFSGWNHKKNEHDSNSPNFETAFSLNGSIQAGIIVDFWLGLDTNFKGFAKDYLKLGTGLDLYIGPKFSGNFFLKKESESPNNEYSTYKDSKIGIDWLHLDYEFFGEASLAGHKFPKRVFSEGSLDSWINHDWYIMPEFSDLSTIKDAVNRQVIINTVPTRDILFPLNVGMGLYNEEGSLLSTKYENQKYKRENEGFEIKQAFSSLEKGKKYIVRPFIKIFNEEIPALPTDTVKLNNEAFCPDSNHPHLIDLGLPSGTKWACCNVGATTPEDYGGYYAWGETEKKTDYNWRTYEHCDGSYSTCYNLGSNIAGSDYDVALVNWGGSWCMPTSEQFKELIDNCTHEWIEYNGFYGRKFTGTNGNSIFLPAAGDRYDSKLYDTGSKGYYWSDTLYPEENSQAYYLNLDNESENVRILNGYRYYGHSVRPVVK